MHYPTDVSLLWDALRCLVREIGRASEQYAVRGWRQWRHLTREVKKLFNNVRSTRRAKRHPERVEAYLERCRALVERPEETLDALRDKGVPEFTCRSIAGFVAHARRQIAHVERRLLRGETIPHAEKVFSIFEEHTRWISKGKAGTPVELGVPVALIHPSPRGPVGGRGRGRGGADVQEAQARYPEMRACSSMGWSIEDSTVFEAMARTSSIEGTEQRPLPRKQSVQSVLALRGDAFERRPRRDQLRVDGQLLRGPVAPLPERCGTLLLGPGEPRAPLDRGAFRPLHLIESQRAVRCLRQARPPWAAQSAGRCALAEIEAARGVDEIRVRQDVERRSIRLCAPRARASARVHAGRRSRAA